jgi:predicted nucleotide-binding protein
LNRRVFLTHGKNKSLLGTLRELLAFGEFEAVISVERETVSQPVPDKVMEDMRKCAAAIIHVDAEKETHEGEGAAQFILNPNVLIEIGAAMGLYGRRFILLVREGVKLPSNLQGLYEVRYQGDKLDSDATIKLLKAINDIKNHPLPTFGANN